MPEKGASATVFGVMRGYAQAATGPIEVTTSEACSVVREFPAYPKTGPRWISARCGGTAGEPFLADAGTAVGTGGAAKATSAAASDTVKASTGGAARVPRSRATTKSAKSSSGGGV